MDEHLELYTYSLMNMEQQIYILMLIILDYISLIPDSYSVSYPLP